MMKLDVNHGVYALAFWFIVLTFLVYLIFFNFRPKFVLLKDEAPALLDNLDYKNMLLYSAGIALLAMVVIYLLGRN